MFLGDRVVDALKGVSVILSAQAVHVVASQLQIHLGESHLHFGDQHPEERPALV